MKDLLLEIGIEEVPAAYMPAAVNNLQKIAKQMLTEANISFTELKVFATARRMTLLAEGMSEVQSDELTEIKGPKKSIAYDGEGNPSKAGQGFARAQGFEFNDLIINTVDGVEYVFAIKKTIGQSTALIMPNLLEKIILGMSFPKSMRWGYNSTRFARPIRWLLAFFGDEFIEFSIENIKSQPYTMGHRFLSTDWIKVESIPQYFALLPEHQVILDQEVRRSMVLNQINDVAAACGGHPMENDDLLEEINYLVEYPTAFVGKFSKEYLSVPPEVLITSMIEHQRYYPMFDGNESLLPNFIGVRNGGQDFLENVIAGNERVLKARLEDALFFWNEDLKKDLASLAQGLANVMHHEQLGSLSDKIKRVEELAVYLGNALTLSDEDIIIRSAKLCKADLLSQMVYEFPELQGIMGRYYAIEQKEKIEVAEAIFEHYLPRFAGDELPCNPTGIVLSLADKIDNITAFFAIGIKPSGSQDPYALRRQALGVINIILENKLEIDLPACIGKSLKTLKATALKQTASDIVDEIMSFFAQRLRGVFSDRGYSYDVIDALLSTQVVSLSDILDRVNALQEFKNSADYQDFIVVFNRANNLAKKETITTWSKEALVEKCDFELYEAMESMKNTFKSLIDAKEYNKALLSLASLRRPLDEFFTQVMVMVDDTNLRSARLGLLFEISQSCLIIADFSKLA